MVRLPHAGPGLLRTELQGVSRMTRTSLDEVLSRRKPELLRQATS